jgi:hypothetical protein
VYIYVYTIAIFTNLFSVKLVGGSNEFEGNVFAKNPKTEVYGPVCDDNWTFENVRNF